MQLAAGSRLFLRQTIDFRAESSIVQVTLSIECHSRGSHIVPFCKIGEFAYSARLRSRTVARLVGKIEFDDGKIYAH